MKGTTAEREEMCGLLRNIRDGCVHYFYLRISLVYTYVKYQTVNFKYGQFNVCQLYSVRWLEKLSEKLFQKFKVYRSLLQSMLFLLVNVPLPVNVYTKLMGKVLYKYKSGHGD